MAIHSVYILCKNGGLIYQYDHNAAKSEIEKAFSYPLDLKLVEENKRFLVTFGGQKDGIHAGNTLLGKYFLPQYPTIN